MKLKDFVFSRMLVFEPDEGRLTLGDERMLLFRQEAFAFLRTLLVEQLGEQLSQAMLAQFGYRSGFGDYQALSERFDWESEVDRLSCGPVMHTWEGIVAVEPLEMDYDRSTGHFLFRGLWRNSYEAEIHLQRFGRSEHPVCATLSGYASGWSTAFFGQPLLCVETSCEAQGADHWCVRSSATHCCGWCR